MGKVFLVISSLSSGGAERVMAQMASYWAAAGWEVTLATLAPREDFYALHARVKRVRLSVSPTVPGRWRTLVGVVSGICRLRRAIRQARPDAVLSFMDTANVLTLVASCGLGVRTVVAERTDPGENHRLGKFWKVTRLLMYRFADLVVTQTARAEAWVRGNCHAKTVVIPNPLRSLSDLHVVRESLVVSLGRLVPEKGFEVLVRAFARVAPRFPEWRLAILGDGPEEPTLRALVDTLGLARQVVLAGRVRDVEPWLARAGLVVQASRFEGFPNALLEAMGMGAAVVSTDCRSGPREIITDGVDGRLVPVEDVEAMAEVMAELMDDAALRARLGAAAMRVRETYAESRIMGQWEAALKGAI